MGGGKGNPLARGSISSAFRPQPRRAPRSNICRHGDDGTEHQATAASISRPRPPSRICSARSAAYRAAFGRSRPRRQSARRGGPTLRRRSSRICRFRPRPRADAQDFLEDLRAGKAGESLGKDQAPSTRSNGKRRRGNERGGAPLTRRKPALEGEKVCDMVLLRGDHVGVVLRRYRGSRAASFGMLIEGAKASGTGQSGSRMERTWLTPASQWSASSSMPQMLTLNGAMVPTGDTPEECE